MGTVTISNIAGGDAKTFPWDGEQLSDRAIRHADRCSEAFGGVNFSDPAAADAYERVCEDREHAA